MTTLTETFNAAEIMLDQIDAQIKKNEERILMLTLQITNPKHDGSKTSFAYNMRRTVD